MKKSDEGGRSIAFSVGYPPHLVVPPNPMMLGVRVFDVEGDDGLRVVDPGAQATVLFQLMYHPDPDYSDLVEGAEFNILEGARIVGAGRVIVGPEFG